MDPVKVNSYAINTEKNHPQFTLYYLILYYVVLYYLI